MDAVEPRFVTALWWGRRFRLPTAVCHAYVSQIRNLFAAAGPLAGFLTGHGTDNADTPRAAPLSILSPPRAYI
jgi:hypothetical protein